MLERKADTSYISFNKDDIKNFTDVDESNWAYYDIMEACNGHYYEMDDAENLDKPNEITIITKREIFLPFCLKKYVRITL